MAHLFQPNRSLLYPQFETYRLRSLDVDEDTASYKVPGNGATQSRVGYNNHHLSFKEVRGRIGWDHLAVGSGGRAIYIDVDWKVIGLQLDGKLQPVFTELASLPEPISSKDQVQEPEYPSAAQLDEQHWALSTGAGSIYVLETSAPGSEFSGKLGARYDLDSPFLLRAAHLQSRDQSRLLLSRTTPSSASKRTQDKSFDLIEVSLDPTARNGVDASPGSPTTRWSLTSGDLPYWCGWWQDGWIVLSGEEYRDAESHASASSSTTPSALSRAGLGADETQADAKQPVSPGASPLPEERDWPFSWRQDADTISMTFALPAETKRSDLVIGLKPDSFSFSVGNDRAAPSVTLSSFLRKASRSWWSTIDAESSTFTFDSGKSLLELEIVKADDHSRWPSVFAPSDDDEDQEEEEEVPETLDAATLAAVRNTFSNIKTRDADEPEGQHPAIPALLREEMEIDMDDDEDFDQAEGPYGDSAGKVGRDCFIGYITDGQPKWTKTTSTVLSLPIQAELSQQGSGIMVKSAVDGLLYSPEDGSDPIRNAWTHQSTSPALAFVLSSKRDLRLVRHLSLAGPAHDPAAPPDAKKAKTDSPAQTTVLAFDAGSYGGQAQGNVYVYYPPSSKTHASQGVVGVSGRERGALLGVGAVTVGDKQVVLALCEKELVVLGGVV